MSLIFHSTFHSVLYSIHIQYALGILFFLSSGTKIKRKKIQFRMRHRSAQTKRKNSWSTFLWRFRHNLFSFLSSLRYYNMFFRRTARCLGYFSTLAAPPADFPKFHNYPAVKLGVVSAMNSVPKEIEKPSYYFDGHAASSEKGVQIHTPEVFARPSVPSKTL